MLRRNRLLLLLLLLPVVLVAVIWTTRRPISEAVVARWFAGQQVEARYRVTAISPGGVTLADVSLGPAAAPEFTADRIEAGVGWSPLRPRIDRVVLNRPRLRVTLNQSGISLGSLERLLPTPQQIAQPLPDIDVRIVAGRIVAATPAGSLTGSFDGSGRLRAGFRGFGSIDAAPLALAGCAATLAGARFSVTTGRDDTAFHARGSFPLVACNGRSVAAAGWQVAATLPPTLDRYAATFTAATGRLDAGSIRAATLTLSGDAAAASLTAPIAGRFDLRLAEAIAPSLRAKSASARGSYRFAPATRAASATARVALDGAAATVPDAALRRASRSAAGTLGRPLLDRLAGQGRAAARSFAASADVAAALDAAGARGTLAGLTVRSASGARLDQTGQVEITPAGFVLRGGATIAGGGLPQLVLAGDGAWRDGLASGSGTLTSRRWAVPGASLDALRLSARGSGRDFVVDGGVRVSGAVGGGVVARGLGMPVALSIGPGGLRFGTRCLPVDWSELRRGDVRLARGAVRVCPTGNAIVALDGSRLGGNATVAGLNLSGTKGGVPLALAAAPTRMALAGTTSRPLLTFAPVRLDLRYGARRGQAVVSGSIDATRLTGSGRITAARLDDPASPVNIGDTAATWRLTGGRVGLTGVTALVTDRTAPARFQPMRVTADATVADGIVKATGSGALATSGARLFGFTATHELTSGRGSATAETGVLTFGPALQPYQVTENLRGIVADVRGPVSGTGRFAWTADTLTSTGTARIDHVSLATASLGPVDDIAGNLVFDDLLAMTTPPGQVLTIKRINPGVAVEDGTVVFRMLAPDAAAIAGIGWPYAGGNLTLAPVTIRGTDVRRDFLLTVDGLDAELFLQKFEIKNLNVTGRFDGRLPLVFENGKGRLEAGRLVAREGGGLVQYVGEVGNEQLGAGAKLAFDALRRLRYKSLALDLDGDLDGELVTQLRFAGTNETAATLGGGPLPIRATGLPFKFSVTVRAPFRALLGTAASFSDVRPLIRPAAEQVQPR